MRNFSQYVFLVAHHELQARVRTSRWKWMLGVWTVIVGSFTFLLSLSLENVENSGTPLFGGLMLFVLALTLIVSPALTAQSINGERERGTLATVQITMLKPSHLAVGKLLAGWMVGLCALALTLPFVGWALLQGGASLVRVIVVMMTVAILIGVICAVSQAFSALVPRTIASAVLSYIAVFALTIGTVIAFGLSAAIASTHEEDSNSFWPILAPNPFVILADATPRLPEEEANNDPLGEFGHEIRQMRAPSRDSHTFDDFIEEPRSDPWLDSYAVWPYGLGVNILVGLGSVLITIRRLRTPAGQLPKGMRIA